MSVLAALRYAKWRSSTRKRNGRTSCCSCACNMREHVVHTHLFSLERSQEAEVWDPALEGCTHTHTRTNWLRSRPRCALAQEGREKSQNSQRRLAAVPVSMRTVLICKDHGEQRQDNLPEREHWEAQPSWSALPFSLGSCLGQ